MTKTHQILIRNSKGQLLSIVQADGGGHGIMGNTNSGQVEAAGFSPLADAPDGYLDAMDLANVLLHFEEHGTNPAQIEYEEDMNRLNYDGDGWTDEDINIMEREMFK
tara:strand:+ start:37738 stop:38058 length:321 start_codon:yes stop_codon:yes gene_type:complete